MNADDLIMGALMVIGTVVLVHWITAYAPPHLTMVTETETGTQACGCNCCNLGG